MPNLRRSLVVLTLALGIVGSVGAAGGVPPTGKPGLERERARELFRVDNSPPAAVVRSASDIPRVLAADPDDRYWDPQFGPSSTDPITIQTIAIKGDSIIVGGFFRYFLGMDAYSLALWNGQRWMPLLTGGAISVTGSVGSISAIAVGPHGELAIAGQFARIGGTSATNLAIYDWQTVRQIPGTIDGTITTLAWVGNDLYVGGAFNSIDGIAGTSGIARWDGSQWHALGEGIGDGNVSVIYPDRTDLYVGGSFRRAGQVQTSAVARWDGSQWHALGEGLVGETANAPAQVLTLGKLWDGSIVAGGDFYRSGTQLVRYLARWNGSAWEEIGPPDGIVTALLVDGERLYISGGFEKIGNEAILLVAWWDGTSWHPMGGDQINGTAMALARFGENILAGGSFDLPISQDVILRGIALWNGWTWLSVGGSRGNGLDGDVADLLPDGNGNVYAIGTFSKAGPVPSPRIALFTGSRWQAVTGVPFHNQQRLFHRLAPYRNGTIAIAAVVTLNGQPTPAVLSYDPVLRSTEQLGVIGGGFTTRNVFSLVYDQQRAVLYCAGNFRTINGDSVNGIAAYDGQQWRSLAGGITSGSINALAVLPDGTLIAGGNFTAIGGTAASSIARWNGTAWEPLGDGVQRDAQQGTVYALLVQGNWLYVAGLFNRAGSQPCANIARWDWSTNTWSALAGGGTNGAIYALSMYGGRLVAGGEFTRVGDTTANRIAQYDFATEQWLRMGSGLEGSAVAVRALAVAQGALCVGGSFDLAGGRSSRGFARWLGTLSSSSVEPSDAASSERAPFTLFPNPIGLEGVLTATVSLPQSGWLELAAYTLDGRCLGQLWQGTLSAGEHRCLLPAAQLPHGTVLIVARLSGRLLGSGLVAK
ncbi:MAG: hypothetical protein KatS3mg039_1592 [Candidatus Kapaibacterium sp.]|nr:MAG: hypothetical protein KatS3mg039_1592 [Candidatus Kapabacteria bacterium]